MCKKQTSVSHSSTESDVISLDGGPRMDGIPAIDLWDLVLRSLAFFEEHSSMDKHTNTKAKKKEHGNRDDIESFNVGHVITNENLLTSKPCFTFL